MDREPFITPRLSPWLDLLRAGAAFAVLAGHMVQQGIYRGPWPFPIILQQNAVIVFFVLSGVVIAHAVDRRYQRPGAYVLARVLRIGPVAFPALAFSVLVAAFARSRGISVGDDAHGCCRSVWEGVLPAAFFLSESHRTGLWINPPWWSLCYEVWFYALFGVAHYGRGGTRIGGLLVLALIAGPNVLLLLPAWLCGVWAARAPGLRAVSIAGAWLRVAMGVLALQTQGVLALLLFPAFVLVARWVLGYALYAPSNWVLALAIALAISGLRALTAAGRLELGWAARPLRSLAGFSFSLYVLHWPLIGLLRAFGISAGSSPLRFLGLIALIALVSFGYATLTEHRRDLWRALANRLLAIGRAGLRPALRLRPAD